MSKTVPMIAAAGLLVVSAAYYAWWTRQAQQDEETQQSGAWSWDGINTELDKWSNSIMEAIKPRLQLSKMRTVTAVDVQHPNVQAFLQVLRRGEGTAGPNGYRTLFGGGLFESYAHHPNQSITRTFGNGKTVTSTAAGAYQFLKSTWDETARYMALPDFTPSSQDLGAVGRIAARLALDDVKAGRFEDALGKVAHEWASMPGSPYGQPVITLAAAQKTYAAHGGSYAA